MRQRSLAVMSFFIILFTIIGCGKEKYVFENLGEPVKSYYTYTEGKLLINQAILFTNASENADSYHWDFGDGSTSTEKNPTKTFKEPGTYSISLRAVGSGGTGNYKKSIVIIDPDAVVLSDKMLYYIHQGNDFAIMKVSVNPGSTPELVMKIKDKSGFGLAYDSVKSVIYFTETKDNGQIWSFNIDGTGLKAIASGFDNPNVVVVDHKSRSLYWANMDGTISKSNLDGSNLVREFVKIDGADFRALAVNSKTGELYFTDYEEEILYKCKADGTGVVEVDDNAYGFSIFVDEVNDKLYYDSRRKFGIMKSNLDGTNSSLFFATGTTNANRVYGMAFDYEQNKIYWSQYSTDDIVRLNLDGTKKEEVISGLDTPRGIFLR